MLECVCRTGSAVIIRAHRRQDVTRRALIAPAEKLNFMENNAQGAPAKLGMDAQSGKARGEVVPDRSGLRA